MLNLRARVTGSTPGERAVRDRLFSFCDWCAQHDDIAEQLMRNGTKGPRYSDWALIATADRHRRLPARHGHPREHRARSRRERRHPR